MIGKSIRPAAAVIAAVGLLAGAGARALEAPAGPDFIVADGDTLWLAEPLEIVGSRVPVALPGIVRPVRVLDQADLAAAPARSVGEALQAMPGVIVGQRQQ